MKKYNGSLEHFVVIQCDYDNAEKIRNLLNDNDEIEGDIIDDSKHIVLTNCPSCGDDEFWYYGKCGHCGYEV